MKIKNSYLIILFYVNTYIVFHDTYFNNRIINITKNRFKVQRTSNHMEFQQPIVKHLISVRVKVKVVQKIYKFNVII